MISLLVLYQSISVYRSLSKNSYLPTTPPPKKKNVNKKVTTIFFLETLYNMHIDTVNDVLFVGILKIFML